MTKTQEEIFEVLDQCGEAAENGSKFPGMTYEDGVRAAIEWLTEESDESPMAD